jgi:hypothetical protein
MTLRRFGILACTANPNHTSINGAAQFMLAIF